MRLVEFATAAVRAGWPGALLPRPFGERAGVRGRRRWMCACLAPSPLWGEGWGEGLRRWIGSLWFDVLLTLHAAAGRDVRPAAQSLSLLRQRKEPKKGDPTGRVPSLRCGQAAMLAPGAVLRNSLRSLRSLRSDNRSKPDHQAHASCGACVRPRPCASRHGQRGVEPQHGPSLRLRRGACGVARAPQDARASWSGARGLFERRERSERSAFHRAPRKRCGAGLPRSEAQGSQTWGRFLLPPFLVRTRKGGALPGAHPGQQVQAELAAHRTAATKSNAQPLTPALSPKGRGSKA